MTPWRVMTVATSFALATTLAAQQGGRKESIVAKLLRIAGLTAAPSQMRGPGDLVVSGNLWIVRLDERAPRPLTNDGGYRSPVVAGDGTVYALRGDAIVRTRVGGSPPTTVQKAPGVLKLVGFDPDSRGEIVVLLEAAEAGSPLAAVSVTTGARTPLPYDAGSEDARRVLAQIRAQDRVYGDTVVYTRSETKRGLSRTLEWTDVYVKRGSGSPVNVSTCDGVDCVQPALAPDGRTVIFVKSSG